MSSENERRPAGPSSTLGAKLRAAEARADLPPSDLTQGVPGVLERARGVMLGLAVGDALGSTLEFGPRIASVADFHTEMTGGGRSASNQDNGPTTRLSPSCWRKAS